MKRSELQQAIDALKLAKELARPLVKEIIVFKTIDKVPSLDVDTTIRLFEEHLLCVEYIDG